MSTQAADIHSAVIPNTDEIDFWAMVEIFGHTKVAGRVQTRKLGVNVMIQVDVPKGDGTEFSHSQLFSPAAIFSINPTTEIWCRRWAKQAASYDRSPLPYIPEDRQLAETAKEQAAYDDADNQDEDDYDNAN